MHLGFDRIIPQYILWYMEKTLLTVKTDKKLKKEAGELAEELGLPLGTVVNAFLRQFVEDRSITFSRGLRPTPYLQKLIKEARRDYATGKNISPTFTNAKDAIAWLNS